MIVGNTQISSKFLKIDSARQGLLFDTLQWRHNELDGVSNHRRLDCLLKCLFMRRSQNSSKLCDTGLCDGNPPVTGGFPSQRASNAETVSLWWRHHEYSYNADIIACSYRCVNKSIEYAHNSSMMSSSNGNIFRVTGHLCGEFIGPRWIPRTKASDAELWCFLSSAPE